MFTILDGRKELWQWDIDRKIVVEDASIVEVHYCNGLGDCSLACAVRTENGKRIADIPNILLQDHPQCKLRGFFELRVFAYCAGDYTKAEETIKVMARTKPEDYVYTETEGVQYKIAEIVQTKGNSADAVMSQKAVSDEISRANKRITNLEKGLADDNFMIDDAVAYAKDVPANALPFAAVNEIGGMTYKDGDTLRSAKVTDVKSVGANLWAFGDIVSTEYAHNVEHYFRSLAPNKQYVLTWEYSSNGTKDTQNCMVVYTEAGSITIASGFAFTITEAQLNTFQGAFAYFGSDMTSGSMTNIMLNKGSSALHYKPYQKHTLPIPEAVRPANGINAEAHDYIEWDESGAVKAHKKCGEILVDGVNTKITFGGTFNGLFYGMAQATKAKGNGAIVCDKFKSQNNAEMGAAYITADGFLTFFAKDASIQSAADFNAWFASNPTTVIYELETPEITDITDKITADNFLYVEGGGTITFENENGIGVPSTIEYQLEV